MRSERKDCMPRFKEIRIPLDSRPFGMEFEFTRACGQDALAEAIRYALPDLPRDGIRMADWEHTPANNPDWVVKRDGSCGWEISTPVSQGPGDLRRCCDVLEACKKVGAKVGPRTGIHLHYQIRDFTMESLGKLIAYWIKLEGMIFFSLPRKRRANSFCLSLSRTGDVKIDGHYSYDDLIHITGDHKYRALNIKPFLQGDIKKIEVRVIEGTMDPSILWNWTAFFFHFIQRVKESRMPNDLRWFGLDEAMEWLHWYGREGDTTVYIPDQEMANLRDWWLRRIYRYASVRAKLGAYKERAKEFIRYFREGNCR